MTEAFLQLYVENLERVYRYLAYRTGSRSDAEDLTQVTFERAFRGWDRFDPRKGSARTWLLAIARNSFLDFHRRRRSEDNVVTALKEETAESQPGPGALGIDPDLAAALRSLSQRERSVLALRFGGELDGGEIGQLLDLSTANVHQITSRALAKLRQYLLGR
ncbi:MAG: RNA polymerase sigma factor, partial [Actinomycetota bacterium]